VSGGAPIGAEIAPDRESAVARAAEWRERDLAIVFTNGVFDLVHRGHTDALAQAKQLGDRLIVGVNDDASVRRLKGPARPLVALEDRMALLAALAAVDLVVAFSEDTPEELIRELRPDVLVKGADYRPEEIAGGAFVRSYGGRVETVALTPGRATSALIDRILDRHSKERETS
jgi:D-beta-D-heptose 7-phosphate kinase/D-beta-D-heptose 1-phosphate adenosyltransferase